MLYGPYAFFGHKGKIEKVPRGIRGEHVLVILPEVKVHLSALLLSCMVSHPLSHYLTSI